LQALPCGQSSVHTRNRNPHFSSSVILLFRDGRRTLLNLEISQPSVSGHPSPQHAARTGTGRWRKPWRVNFATYSWQHHLPQSSFARLQEPKAEGVRQTVHDTSEVICLRGTPKFQLNSFSVWAVCGHTGAENLIFALL
jgi:hypothetical protein